MNEMLSEHGVTNKRWSDADLAVLEKAWNEVLDEVAQEDELFAKAAASYREFPRALQDLGRRAGAGQHLPPVSV